LSSPSGRYWSCFKKIVSRTALSAVGAAFSAGAGVGAVYACAPELNAKTPAIAAIATSDPIARPTAVSFFERLIAFTGLFQAAIVADRRRL